MSDEELIKAVKKGDPLVVGDHVKLLNGGGEYPLSGFRNGETYYIAQLDYLHDGQEKIHIRKIGSDRGGGFAYPHQLERV